MWEHAKCGISDLLELKLHSDALTVCAARHWLLMRVLTSGSLSWSQRYSSWGRRHNAGSGDSCGCADGREAIQ